MAIGQRIADNAFQLARGLDAAAAASSVFSRHLGGLTTATGQLTRAVGLLARREYAQATVAAAAGLQTGKGVAASLAAQSSANGLESVSKAFSVLEGTVGRLLMPAFVVAGGVALTLAEDLGEVISKNLPDIVEGWSKAITKAIGTAEEFGGFLKAVAAGKPREAGATIAAGIGTLVGGTVAGPPGAVAGAAVGAKVGAKVGEVGEEHGPGAIAKGAVTVGGLLARAGVLGDATLLAKVGIAAVGGLFREQEAPMGGGVGGAGAHPGFFGRGARARAVEFGRVGMGGGVEGAGGQPVAPPTRGERTAAKVDKIITDMMLGAGGAARVGVGGAAEKYREVVNQSLMSPLEQERMQMIRDGLKELREFNANFKQANAKKGLGAAGVIVGP